MSLHNLCCYYLDLGGTETTKSNLLELNFDSVTLDAHGAVSGQDDCYMSSKIIVFKFYAHI